MQFQNISSFDSSSITKYFKNQTPISLNCSTEFTDPLFPPNKNSLMALDINENPIDKEQYTEYKDNLNEDEIDWKRISKIFIDYKLFTGTIKMDDIKQGDLGNCYFLSALAALTQYPKLIANLFRNSSINFKSGYYEVIFFLDGQWQIVIVDDYFPVKKDTGKLLFCKPNMNEVWAIVLEKAWAKVNGGYLNTIAGLCGEVLQFLTGAPYLEVINNLIPRKKLWKMFYEAYKNNYVIGTGTYEILRGDDLGLVGGHAYSVLQLEEIKLNGEIHQLIKLRNPWGKSEWNGEWSDNSPLWTQELKEKLKLKIEDDGTFWMSFDEYVRFYNISDIAYLQFDSANYGHIVEDCEVLNHPLIYRLKINQKTNVGISVISKNRRFNRETADVHKAYTVVISKIDSSGKPEKIVQGMSTGHSLSYLAELDKGEYCVFVYGALSSYTVYGQLSIKFSVPSCASLSFLGYDNNFEVLRFLIQKKIEEEYKHLYEEMEYYCDEIKGFFDKYGVLPFFLKNNRSQPIKIITYFSSLYGVTIQPILGKDYKNYETMDKFEINLRPQEGYVILLTRSKNLTSSAKMDLAPDVKIISNDCEFKINSNHTYTKKITGFNYSYYINSVKSLQESTFYSYTGKETLDELYSSQKFTKVYYDALKSFIKSNEETVGYDLLWNIINLDGDKHLYIGQLGMDGKFHGYGLLKYYNNIYVGYFKDGMKEICGRVYSDYGSGLDLNDGIECEFYKNKMNGYGKKYSSGKIIFSGIFDEKEKKIEGVSKEGMGRQWKGKWKNDKKHGVGVLFFEDYNVAFESAYEWDEPVMNVPFYHYEAKELGCKEVDFDKNDFILGENI